MDCFTFFWESNSSGCYDEKIFRKDEAFLQQPFFVSFQKLNVAINLDLKVYLRLRDLDSIATPSVRSGGATAAAANAGVPDPPFKWHCRWLGESTRIVMSKIPFPPVCLYLRL